ncbi:MAG: alpha/beta hydrolase [Chloroflexi bacterium]|nr:alpha/beta hydrolase [Chloroflexota bacterium]MBM3174930.1 alpha/beta hydrolase [Chloroflexota bacterium]
MPTIKLSKIEMNYEVAGEGPPLVFIPGLYSSAVTSGLNALRPYFDKRDKHYKIIIADSRGCGLSSKVDFDFSTEDMAEDWNELLEVLKVKEAFIVGSSMGSMIAQYLAINHSDKVRSLVLVDSIARANKYLIKTLDFWCLVLERFDYADFSKLVNLMCLPWTLYEQYYDQIDQLERLAKEMLGSLPLFDHTAYKRLCHAIAMHDCMDKIHGVKVPTLVVSGDNDLICPAPLAEAMAGMMPAAGFVLVKDSGHGVALQQTEQLGELILKFHDQV